MNRYCIDIEVLFGGIGRRENIFVTRNTYICIEYFVDECFDQGHVCSCVEWDLQAELFNLRRLRKLRLDAIATKCKHLPISK